MVSNGSGALWTWVRSEVMNIPWQGADVFEVLAKP
jgi:hypothetical protein